MNWYYKNGEKEIGPVAEEAMKALIEAGVVNASCLVKQDSTSDWAILSDTAFNKLKPKSSSKSFLSLKRTLITSTALNVILLVSLIRLYGRVDDPINTQTLLFPSSSQTQMMFPVINPVLPTNYLARQGAFSAVSDYEGRHREDYLRGLQDALEQDQAQLVPQSPKAILKPWGWGNFRRNTGRLIERGFDSVFPILPTNIRLARLKQINSDLREIYAERVEFARMLEQRAIADAEVVNAERDALRAQADLQANTRGYEQFRDSLNKPPVNTWVPPPEPVEQPTRAPLPPAVSAPGIDYLNP